MKSMAIPLEKFNVKVMSIVPETLCCLICANVLDNPHQAPCGCRFCYSCINDFLKDGARICPGLTEECIDEKLNIERHLRPDMRAKREINKVIVMCPFNLCNEELELRLMRDHVTLCASSSVPCHICSQLVTRAEYEKHVATECLEAIVGCDSCQATMTRKMLTDEHHSYVDNNLCLGYTDFCPNECGERGRVVWVDHRRICRKKLAACPYHSIGCTINNVTMRDMSRHMADNGFEHAEVLLKHVDNLNNEIAYLNNALTTVTNDIAILTKKCSANQTTEIQRQKDEIAALVNTIKEMKQENLRISTQVQGQIKMEVTASMRDTHNLIDRMRDEMARMRNELDSMKNKPESGNLENEIRQFKPEKKVYCSNVLLSWIVLNFSLIHTNISPPFYTDVKGYKLDLNLEKRKKGFLSIYVRLKCGEYDEDLKWPLRKRVTVRIVDQDKLDRDYDKVIKFNEKAGKVCDRQYFSSTGDFGFSEFISYDELKAQRFLSKNNKLFINCYVDDF